MPEERLYEVRAKLTGRRIVAERWWAIRWHVVRVVVGTPVWFATSLLDGFRAFRSTFGDTWSGRWRAKDREEAWRRFGGQGEAEEAYERGQERKAEEFDRGFAEYQQRREDEQAQREEDGEAGE